MPRPLPMRGGAAAVKKAGLSKHVVSTGANAGDADAAPGHRTHERQRLRAGRRRRHPLAARHDQGADRARGLKPRASNSTPEVLRTGPGVAAKTLMADAAAA